ncbi:MAG: hypothetical protein ACRDRV_17935 [Pseudonocardiaceae bacterium]
MTTGGPQTRERTSLPEWVRWAYSVRDGLVHAFPLEDSECGRWPLAVCSHTTPPAAVAVIRAGPRCAECVLRVSAPGTGRRHRRIAPAGVLARVLARWRARTSPARRPTWMQPVRWGAAARVGAALAYRELGWPVRVRGEQLWLNLDLDLDAVAVVIPGVLAARVAEILVGRRCPPTVLAHPALAGQRVFVAGERFDVALGWPAGVHRVTGTLLLPPTVTVNGPVRWVRPPASRVPCNCAGKSTCARH